MRRVTEPDTISLDEIRALAQARFGDMIKGVVDLERGILLLDADLHADQEASLLADGSTQANLWGINLYPDVAGEDWLEFDSMINLRPSFGNRSRGVDDAGHARGDRRVHCTRGASMTEWQHRDAARGRWQSLSLAEQFGNVGSEISRAIRWSTKNPETAQAALYRGLELFDLMLDDPQHRGSVARLREIARAREVVVDFLAGRTSTAQPARRCRSTSTSSRSPRAVRIWRGECSNT